MKHRYYRFLEHAENDDAPHYAIEAIMEFAGESEPIPEDLLPYLRDACNAYQGQLGNRVSNPVTKQMWIRKIAAVRIFIDSGLSPNEAIKRAAAIIDSPCDAESLRTKYYSLDRYSANVVGTMCDLLNEWEHE